MEILQQSAMSLFIEMITDSGELLATATAFTLKYNGNDYLVTNRHNVRGRNNENNKCLSKTGCIPKKIRVYFNKKNEPGKWFPFEFDLYRDFEDENTKIWYEHPNQNVDVVILNKLNLDDNIDFFSYNFESDFDIKISPSDYLSVVGFPFGKRAHGYFVIWTTGFLATDIDLNFDNKPIFLIDCRSRQGQSGSPVIIHRNGGPFMTSAGSLALNTATRTKLLGIYSGRINEKSDLGFVWKTTVIKQIIDLSK